jgi:hypothetical protein
LRNVFENSAPPAPSGAMYEGVLKRADVPGPVHVLVVPRVDPPMPATVEMIPAADTKRTKFPLFSVTQKPTARSTGSVPLCA